ncbi:MAG: serine/threonine protein kinase [Candidatus Ancillula sp.]|jgi:serine/threonine protein kinase|nr:serine/threonine protein kinase [Candidatus Ancillula sp.]
MISKEPILSGYTYIRPLGSGGFTDVYLYQQFNPVRDVAVKVLKAELNGIERQLFITESNIMAACGMHPNVLNVYETGLSQDGRLFIAMEKADRTADEYLSGNKIDITTYLDTAVKIANALEFVNEKGYLHRDIKPENILIDAFNTPKMADFGVSCELAKVQQSPVSLSWGWASPEIMELGSHGSIQSDIYSFGISFYSILTGANPFVQIANSKMDKISNSAGVTETALKGKYREIMSKTVSHWEYQPLATNGTPRQIDQILSQALSFDPKKRQNSFLEISQQFTTVQQQLGLTPTAISLGGVNSFNSASESVFAPSKNNVSNNEINQMFNASTVQTGTQRRTVSRTNLQTAKNSTKQKKSLFSKLFK